MASPASEPAPPRAGKTMTGQSVVVATVATTAVVTALSYLVPPSYSNTAVGLSFLAATWWLVVRHDAAWIRAHGLSMGGLFEPVAIDWKKLARDTASAIAWACVLGAIFFPPFIVGFKMYWSVDSAFTLRLGPDLFDRVVTQLVLVALPEEAFFRGYLQSRLDAVFPKRVRILGAEVGIGLLIASAVFAVGHLLTIPAPARLAVFGPSLLFGWLRARTGGIGASVLFHAMCNLLSSTLVTGYASER